MPPERDETLLDEVGAENGDLDHVADTPADDDPTDERTRPGEYPESDSADTDPEATSSPETADEPPNWEQQTHIERRLRERAEEERDSITARLIQAVQGRENGHTPSDEGPPVSDEEMVRIMREGTPDELLRANEQNAVWREDRLLRRIDAQSTQRDGARELNRHLTKYYDPDGQDPFARAIRARAQRIKSRFGRPTDGAAVSVAALEMAAEMYRKNAPPDPRTERMRREHGNRSRVGRDISRLPGEPGGGRVAALTTDEIQGLKRAGLEHLTRAETDPAKERARIKRIQRVRSALQGSKS
jgi:hypothetical protein